MIALSTLLSPLLWAEATFGSVQLGDPRRTRRAVAIAHALATEMGASLPRQLHDGAALEATYRFLHSGHVNYEDLMRPHIEATRQDCCEHTEVLLIQDTTEVDYQHHPKTRGLGPIGNGSHQGFLLQTVLAVGPQSRQVLGIAHQEPFLRQPAPAKETKQQRLRRERESQVWECSVQALGSPPEGVRWVHIGDRYSDIFSFLTLCRELKCDFVIRAAQDRCVDLLVEQAERSVPPRSHHAERPSPPALHLFEVVESWPAQASSTVDIDASQKRKARTATVSLSWHPLRLMQLRSASRQDPEQPASQVLPSDVVAVVAHLEQRSVETMTVQQCWHAVARYGGYLGRKSDGPPGWETLWRGWLHLQTLLEVLFDSINGCYATLLITSVVC